MVLSAIFLFEYKKHVSFFTVTCYIHTMKKILCLVSILLYSLVIFAEETEQSEIERQKEVLLFGLESEIASLIDDQTRDKDDTFEKEITEVFNTTQSSTIKEKVVRYFIALEDPAITDYAIEVLEDPLGYKSALVNAVFAYVTELDIKEALPAIVEIIKTENETFFYSAITALGELGSNEEAVLLTDYLDHDFPLAQKQALVQALGKLQAIETWDTMVELAEDVNENTYMRSYAAEAIGNMKKTESIPILVKLFDESDPIVRGAVVTGLQNFNDPQAHAVILSAFRDNNHGVRLKAIEAAKELKLTDAVPVLMYRAKNDPDTNVKIKSYEALAIFGTAKSNDFLVSLIEDPRASNAAKIQAAKSILEHQFSAGISAVVKEATKTLTDDAKKPLRYELGKILSKYESGSISDICLLYLESTDVATKGIGLDMFSRNFFGSARAKVDAIAADEKDSANQRKAKLVLERGKI